MAVALVLKMHLVRSIKLTLKPNWLHRLHNLTPNLLGMGSGGGVTLLYHPRYSYLLTSYSLYLLLISLAPIFLVLFIFPYETILPTF